MKSHCFLKPIKWLFIMIILCLGWINPALCSKNSAQDFQQLFTKKNIKVSWQESKISKHTEKVELKSALIPFKQHFRFHTGTIKQNLKTSFKKFWNFLVFNILNLSFYIDNFVYLNKFILPKDYLSYYILRLNVLKSQAHPPTYL